MSRRPNILLLLSDEHSHRFMGHVPESRGGESDVDTPNLDKLAGTGTVFTDAYCQMPLCTPSRISLLTGKEVRKSGAWSNASVLRPELNTIPNLLKDAGYNTCLSGKMHLGGNLQYCGFEARPYGDLTGGCGHQWEPLERDDRGSMRGRTAYAGVSGIPESLLQENNACREALSWLREQQHATPDNPWFTCVSFSRPHFPLTAPKRWIDRYKPEAISRPKIGATGDAYDHPMSVGMRKGFMAEHVDDDEMMKARSAYFACVSFLDEIIGDFLAQMSAAGMLDDTIIVYTTDHGEMAGEHGVWWKNGWYEACTRVPLIISTPEQRRGDTPAYQISTPVALVDLLPTLCTFGGTDVPQDVDGIDLTTSTASGVEPEDRPIFCDALEPRWGKGTEFRSIRWRSYKYVRFRNCDPLFFDLANDPMEQRNLLQRPDEMNGAAQDALAYLEAYARESIDFDEAEKERTERDGSLREDHAQELTDRPKGANIHVMPNGQLISSDVQLYHPHVVGHRDTAFADYGGKPH